MFKSINTKISITFLCAITILIMISNSIVYILINKMMTERIMNDQEYVIYHNRLNIENFFNGINQATVYLYTDNLLADVLNKKDSDRIEQLFKYNKFKEQFKNYMNAPVNSGMSIKQSILYVFDEFPVSEDLETMRLEDTYSQLNNICSDKAVRQEAWFEKTLKMNGLINTFMFEEDKSMVYAARLIRNQSVISSHNIDDIGIVVMSFSTYDIGSLLEFSELTKSTQIMLVNDEGKIIYSNNKEDIYENINKHPIMGSILNLSSLRHTETFITGTGDNKCIVGVNPIQRSWKLISIIPNKDIEEELQSVLNVVMFSGSIAIIAAMIFTLLMSRNIARPIKKLANVMRQVKDEDSMDIYIEHMSNDEIGVFYSSFNKMMKRINKLVLAAYESSKKQKNTELRALQAQINPHFIYNTLDSVGWLALTRNQDDIAEMISVLAEVMRYSIKKPEEMVSVQEEITNINNYVSIQKIRYQNMFDIKVILDESVLKYMIPKFIIQPLVENAITHGLQQHSEKVYIDISGRLNEGQLTLEVNDNGKGSNTDTLNNYLKGIDTSLKDSDGFGIKNVNDRIKLNFGESSRLEYESNSEGGLTARIIILQQKI